MGPQVVTLAVQSFANLDENMITYWSKAIMSNGLKFADLDEIMITSLSVLHGGLFVHVVLSLEHRESFHVFVEMRK